MLIMHALLSGCELTPFEANRIGHTTDGTRIIRKIRETLPVQKCQVDGEHYYKYWIDKDFLAELKRTHRQMCDTSFVDNWA